MGFFDSFFLRKPQDYLAKGEKYMAAGSYYEARCVFEEGLASSNGKQEFAHLVEAFNQHICSANNSLALLNVDEAVHALAEGKREKAREHLELAKTLTSDPVVREKADLLIISYDEKINDTKGLEPNASCSSCSSCSPHDDGGHDAGVPDGGDLDPHIHYELLIHQLPEEMFQRYSGLGEDFACMFIAASRDEHCTALELLEAWHSDGHNDDIYWYEKGKILHRLGKTAESEKCFHGAIACNSENHLPYLGLALLLLDESRFDDAADLLDVMITGNIYAGQATMMRGEIYQITGNFDQAIETFAPLLTTTLSKAAAEKIYEILQLQNRHAEAAAVHKQYLKSCSH